MNQPTREEFEHLEEEQRQLKEEFRKLREQITEPIKITRLEIDSGRMHKQLDEVQEDMNVLKIEMAGARADILRVRESQADLRDRLVEHSGDLKAIKGKQDAHTELLGQLIAIGEETKASQTEHTKRFDRLEAIMMQIVDRLT